MGCVGEGGYDRYVEEEVQDEMVELRKNVCSRLVGLRAIPARYLFMERKVAAAVARYRIGYGPDLVSLAKRGTSAPQNQNDQACSVM